MLTCVSSVNYLAERKKPPRRTALTQGMTKTTIKGVLVVSSDQTGNAFILSQSEALESMTTETTNTSGALDMPYDRKTDFPALLSDIEAGTISNVLGLAMSNVALAVANSGKQGEISLKIKLKPASQTDPSILNTVVSMAISEPKPNFGAKKEDFKYDTVAYCGKGGKVTYERPREDVRQQLNILPEGVGRLSVGAQYK